MNLHPREQLKFAEESGNLSYDIGRYTMLPSNVMSRGEVGELFPNGINTPLRAGLVRLPRLRLLDKHVKLSKVPIYAAGKDKSILIRSFVNSRKYYAGLPIEWGTEFTADRFIPRRKGQNWEAAYHSLVVKPPLKPRGRDLELPNDINNVELAWKKRSMARALRDIIPDGERERILQLSQKTSFVPTVSGSLAGRTRDLEESSDNLDEYKWPVKPRKRPVIGHPDVILDMPHFQASIRKNLLDWSSKNMIAAVINHEGRYGVCVVNGDVTINTDDQQFLFQGKCTAAKFSNSGDEIAIGTEFGTTHICKMNPNKVTAELKCCAMAYPCQPQTYDWTKDDRFLAIGCSNGFLTLSSRGGEKRKSKVVRASYSELWFVTFSPNDKYVASCGREPTARVFTLPDLIPFMEVVYCYPVRAMAWHPWESSVLCIGGGAGDGGISMWNVQCRRTLLNRRVNFNGSVDTLAWNKVTGELLVNWFVREGDTHYVAMPVYASMDRITDAIVPGLRENRILYTAWSPNGSYVACQARESVVIYKFIDNESKERLERRRRKSQLHEDEIKKSLSYYAVR